MTELIYFCALATQGVVWFPAAAEAFSLVKIQTVNPCPILTGNCLEGNLWWFVCTLNFGLFPTTEIIIYTTKACRILHSLALPTSVLSCNTLLLIH